MYTELNFTNVLALPFQASFGSQEHYQNMFHATRDDNKPVDDWSASNKNQ